MSRKARPSSPASAVPTKSSAYAALVLQAPGLSCGGAMADSLRSAGIPTSEVHVLEIASYPEMLNDFGMFAIPGGFAHGDDLGAGLILAEEMRYRFGSHLAKFAASGRLMFGICNGFQILTHLGLIPDVRLVANRTGTWAGETVTVRRVQNTVAHIAQGAREVLRIPVAHQEGCAVVRDIPTLRRMEAEGRIVLQYINPNTEGLAAGYPHNPNGSVASIAAACNLEGNVLGMMPHPERSGVLKFSKKNYALDHEGMDFFHGAASYLADAQFAQL